MKENQTNLQEGEPRGGFLSDVLHENPYIDPRIASRATATTQMLGQSQQQLHNPQYSLKWVLQFKFWEPWPRI